MVDHHHRSTTKQAHKPYKSKHMSKGAIKDKNKGKVESVGFERGTRKTPHQQMMSKLDRRNQAKQKRLVKDAEHDRQTNVFHGKNAAPRICAVIPLCEDISSATAVQNLVRSVDIEDEAPNSNLWKVDVGRFKQKLQFITLGRRDVLDALDACRVADFVIFVLSADQEVDPLGEQMLRTIESQGVSNVMTLVQGLDQIEPAKRRPQVLGSLKSFITHFFATQERVHSLDARQDCANVVRSLCTTTPKGIHWREARSWMLVDDMAWPEDASNTVVFTGTVRGRGLKADRLLQVGDWGDFQIEKIMAAEPLESKKKHGADDMAMDDVPQQDNVLELPSEDQDDIADLAPEETAMTDFAPSVAATERKGVLLDDHHYFDEDEDPEAAKPKKLPRGTSKYQSAWYVGDVSDSGSDLEDADEEMDDAMEDAVPADGTEGLAPREPTEYAPSEYPQSEMFLDRSPEDEAEQLAAYRESRKAEAEEDLEFPDEIELHPNVSARERLARYRGLKSLRTSAWEQDEDKPHEPAEWSRLLEIANYKAAQHRMVSEALVGGVAPGTRVHVYVRLGDSSPETLKTLPTPTGIFSLLRHEHKRTSVNHSITLSSDYPAPLKSKDELIMQCGPRRLIINPLFSQAGNTPNNVHKFDRYLHPGQTGMASFIGPLTWGNVPCLYLKRTSTIPPPPADSDDEDNDKMEDDTDANKPLYTLIATGTSVAPSTNRIIAKRAILTGHPYKIHKKLVTIRYMFFNEEDVAWFKAIQLWTKRGRSGYIKESLGTHGYFKATFDGKINPMDAVGMSLYKRMWPRWAREWRPGMETATLENEKGDMIT
ncbi:putative pre-rRNA processing protein Tsr1 [Aureobasidium pullulans]|uniref:Putative pre-rRNA processing protein Tsr1 n=1 Tax=Aureobasidium pullulans TaxID=5580 RepID=A0A4T0C2I9_AURPU|nr:putative pre-rRNA processing protein Tsr1 [Aureobasidium pullulans]